MQVVVLGVDPSFTSTGYGVITIDGQRLKYVEAGTIVSKPKQPIEDRIHSLCLHLGTVICDYSPTEMAIEEVHIGENRATGLMLAHLRGAYLLLAKQRGLSVAHYQPKTVKKAVSGYGGNSKRAVLQFMEVLLKTDLTGCKLDVSDALALAVTHSFKR